MVKSFTRENLGWPSLTDIRIFIQGKWYTFDLAIRCWRHATPRVLSWRYFHVWVYCRKSMDEFLRLIFGSVDECGCRNFAFTRTAVASAFRCWIFFWKSIWPARKAVFSGNFVFPTSCPSIISSCTLPMIWRRRLSSCPLDGFVLSPGLFATQMAEDATGRTSRMARHVHIRNTSLRVAQRWLIACKLFWDKWCV